MANRNTNPGIGKSADLGVMHNPDASRARTHAWLDKRKRVYILIITYPQTTRTRVRTREAGSDRSRRMRSRSGANRYSRKGRRIR